MKQNILFIHGFNSSPNSLKAEQTRLYFQDNFPEVNFVCPQLATSPNEAITQLAQIIESAQDEIWYLMGSSLGGYFATYLAHKYQLLSVLINSSKHSKVLSRPLVMFPA